MKKERLIVDLTPDSMKLIDELVEKTGVSTRAELIRNMVSLTRATVADADGNHKYIIMRK